MFKDKIIKLINVYGVKQQKIIELINSNRVTFPKKVDNNSFEPWEEKRILEVYGGLL